MPQIFTDQYVKVCGIFCFTAFWFFLQGFQNLVGIVLFTSRDLQGFGNLAGVVAIIDGRIISVYKSNSSSIAKESFLIAVESGALIRIKERAFPEI